MIKIPFISILIFIFSCSNETDPCDVMCDNCMGIEQCEECYDNCYNNR